MVAELQRGRRRRAEVQLAVRLVAGEHDAVLAAALGGLREPVQWRDGARRVPGRVDPQQHEALPGDRVEVGQPPALVRERQLDHLGARERRTPRGHGVAGRRHRDHVAPARLHEHLGEGEDRLLGAVRRDDRGVRVDLRPEAPVDPLAGGAAQLRQPDRERIRGDGLRQQGADEGIVDERGRRLARLADAEVDDLDPARGGRGLGLRQPDEGVRALRVEERVDLQVSHRGPPAARGSARARPPRPARRVGGRRRGRRGRG